MEPEDLEWCYVTRLASSGKVWFALERHGLPVVGIASAGGIERLAVLDAQWAEGHGSLTRFGRAFREQTAEKIEEAVAQAMAGGRAESGRG